MGIVFVHAITNIIFYYILIRVHLSSPLLIFSVLSDVIVSLACYTSIGIDSDNFLSIEVSYVAVY